MLHTDLRTPLLESNTPTKAQEMLEMAPAGPGDVSATLDGIPYETLGIVSSYMQYQELGRLATVNKELNKKLMNNDDVKVNNQYQTFGDMSRARNNSPAILKSARMHTSFFNKISELLKHSPVNSSLLPFGFRSYKEEANIPSKLISSLAVLCVMTPTLTVLSVVSPVFLPFCLKFIENELFKNGLNKDALVEFEEYVESTKQKDDSTFRTLTR